MILDVCRLDETGEQLIRAAVRQLQLSTRGYNRVLRLSRTIADLAGSDHIETAHLAEAVQYTGREHGGEGRSGPHVHQTRLQPLSRAR
jgi:magnesium chelatase family protein